MGRYRWFDDKADKLRGDAAPAAEGGITLPGFTQTDATPMGHPGFVTENGAFWDFFIDPADAHGLMLLSFGRGATGDNSVQIGSAYANSAGLESGMFALYSSEPTFTYEADFTATTSCYEDGTGADTILTVASDGGGQNVLVTLASHIDTAGGYARAQIAGSSSQAEPLLIVSTELDTNKLLEIRANGDVEVFTPGGLVLRDVEGGRHRIKVATDGTLSTEVVV